MSSIDQKPRSAFRPAYWAALATLLLMAILSAGVVAGLAGAYSRTLHFRGPFQTERTAGSHLVSIQLPTDNRFGCCGSIMDDSGRWGAASRLRLWINGAEITPPHTAREQIRQGGFGFSHWGQQVFFALPAHVRNDAATQIVVKYPYKFRKLMAAVPIAALILALALMFMAAIGRADPGARRFMARLETLGTRRFTIGLANMVLAASAVATVGLMVAQLGLVHLDQTFTGPFRREDAKDSQLKVLALRPLSILRCCMKAPSDKDGPSSSRLRLWVNGKQLLSDHMGHNALRMGKPGFSHWGDEVYLALPAGTDNSTQTRVRVILPLELSAWTALVPAMAIALFIGLYRRLATAWMQSRSASSILVLKSPYWLLAAFGWTVLVAGVAYLATVAWGWITGEALAPAIPFRSNLGKVLVDALDPAIPLGLLVLAVFGVASGWLTAHWAPDKNFLRKAEIAGLRWMRRYGLFCLAMFYLASVGATWAGTWRGGTNQSVMGLTPLFDSMSYFSSVQTFLYDGRMGEVLSRRPLAGVLRLVSFGVSDFRYSAVILWQAAALAGSTYFAAMALIRWRGLWAGVVFVALAYIATRAHLATLLTEPVGLAIVFVALGFLAEAFRSASKAHAFLAVTLLSAALWVRPGAMFAIPGFTLWYAWSFHKTLRQRLSGFLIACAPVVAIIAVNKMLGIIFASHEVFKGELADALCGLSLGGDWSACLTTYPQEYAKVSQSFDGQIAWLYSKMLHNIQHDPGTFIRTIVHEAVSFWREAPQTLLKGYMSARVPQAFPSEPWLLTASVFGALSLRNRYAHVEAPFWILVCAGITASAMAVYSSDGVRAMAVTYPLLGLFVATVFSSPIAPRVRCARTTRQEVRLGAVLTAAATAALFVLPPVERLIYPAPRASLASGKSSGNTAIVGDLARSTGMLVLADDQPLPHGVPSVHFSRFAEILRVSGVQSSQGIIEPKAPTLPFGFLEMPMLSGSGSRIFITPPEMVTRKDIHAWRVIYEGWNPTGQLFSENWFHVVSAQPYSKPAGQ